MAKMKKTKSTAGNIVIFVILGFLGTFMAVPLILNIVNALKPLDELFLFPPKLYVQNPTLKNFKDLFVILANSWVPFGRYFFNTVFISVLGTLGHVVIASMAAYVLAKHNFKGRKILFGMVVLSLMFAPQVTAIPNYLIMSKLGLIDTYWAIIIPAFAYPLGLYLMKQFMTNIPDAILEAARIDGAHEVYIYWRIAMPMVKPAWLTLIIFSFQQLWNAQGGMFLYKEQLKPLSYAVNQVVQDGGFARAGVQAAVIVIMMIVPIAAFITAQSNIMETMASSGMKD